MANADFCGGRLGIAKPSAVKAKRAASPIETKQSETDTQSNGALGEGAESEAEAAEEIAEESEAGITEAQRAEK